VTRTITELAAILRLLNFIILLSFFGQKFDATFYVRGGRDMRRIAMIMAPMIANMRTAIPIIRGSDGLLL